MSVTFITALPTSLIWFTWRHSSVLCTVDSGDWSTQEFMINWLFIQTIQPEWVYLQMDCVFMVWVGCRWPCWSRCYRNILLMTCRLCRPWFIMANKMDLEYIMVPVNLMPRHQRQERADNKNSERGSRANERRKEIYCWTVRKAAMKQTGLSWFFRAKVTFMLCKKKVKKWVKLVQIWVALFSCVSRVHVGLPVPSDLLDQLDPGWVQSEAFINANHALWIVCSVEVNWNLKDE